MRWALLTTEFSAKEARMTQFAETKARSVGTTRVAHGPSKADHDYTDVFSRSRADIAALLPMPLSQARVLVTGCGYTYPDVVLYSNVAKSVTGLDVAGTFYRDGWAAFMQSKLREGKNLPKAIWLTLKRRKDLATYYARLASLSGRPVRHDAYELYTYDGEHMPFDDAAFDVVISNATLEHVHDLKSFFSECARVTAPGGVSYHAYHNYFSWSGGHISSFSERERAPWGHLRGLHHARAGLLNEAPKETIAQEFARAFQVQRVVGLDAWHRPSSDPKFSTERPDLLTPKLRAELSAYSDEALLTRNFLLVGRKA
jgi:SAM-dependent methyltransferase